MIIDYDYVKTKLRVSARVTFTIDVSSDIDIDTYQDGTFVDSIQNKSVNVLADVARERVQGGVAECYVSNLNVSLIRTEAKEKNVRKQLGDSKEATSAVL